MFDIKDIFVKEYNKEDGIYNCLDSSIFNNEIKKVDIETYSSRSNVFNDKDILNISKENKELVKSLIKYPEGSVFLELGGGNGRFSIYLMKKGYNVIESDIAIGPVKKVKNIVKRNNIDNGFFAIIDAENIPFKENSLDAIFLVASLHHFPNPELAISEISRALKKGGKLLILREPASWQYILFYPFFLILRKFLRKKNSNLFSLADDNTFGFSKRKFRKILKPHFVNIDINGVYYLSKVYINFMLLKSKIFKTKVNYNNRFINILKNIDKKISKIPIINNLSWDWDISCNKK